MRGEKARAVILTVLMIGSVATAGIALAGSATAETVSLDLTAEKNEVITGDKMNAIDVTIENAASGESYEYRLYGPTGEFITGGESSDATFTVTALFDTEGAYTVKVINNAGSQMGTLCIASHYKATIKPSSVPVGDKEITITGTLVDESSNPVAGEVIEINDLEPKRENSRETTNAAGKFTFSVIPDEVGTYAVYDPATAGCEAGSNLQYTSFEVQPMELDVHVNRSAVLAGMEEQVSITVTRNGEPIEGQALKNLAFEITQNGSDVTSNGVFTDQWDDNGPNDGDLWVDTYRVDIDADQSVNAPVVVRVYKPLPDADNPRVVGKQEIKVISPEVHVTPANLTKGLRTDVTITVADPRTGDPLSENAVELKLNVNNAGDVVEIQSGEMNIVQTTGATDGAGSVELQSNEYAIVREDSGDENLRFDISATVFAFHESDSSEEVMLDVLARADDDDGAPPETTPYELFGGAAPVTFGQLNGTAEPSQISVTGESVVHVTTMSATGEPLDRFVDIDGAGINDEIENPENGKLESTEGHTGSDSMIAFSPNPDKTGTITLYVGYDDELVDGDASPPDGIVTDSVEVVYNDSGSQSQNSSQIGTSTDLRTDWFWIKMFHLKEVLV